MFQNSKAQPTFWFAPFPTQAGTIKHQGCKYRCCTSLCVQGSGVCKLVTWSWSPCQESLSLLSKLSFPDSMPVHIFQPHVKCQHLPIEKAWTPSSLCQRKTRLLAQTYLPLPSIASRSPSSWVKVSSSAPRLASSRRFAKTRATASSTPDSVAPRWLPAGKKLDSWLLLTPRKKFTFLGV